ncbi:unnamed protein product [[Candida] boidinii]|uniref:Unnamed protein product n=1 Tax=Candida boidinii TaxID=5477 RepID=A0A9W6WJU4_CANBO|nr:hypothetical protein B5S30_g2693 [[Candida] boidinii]OWB84224.1 hypothetical protein B5S33_g2866 [[Candida] boidinii]GME78010.1 unnamed protein product [[Candida] boidinii]GMF97766.1 unnamed protein product [[Candida] boidinii]
MTISIPELVIPGQPIAPIFSSDNSMFKAGRGCKVANIKFNLANVSIIVSTVLGRVEVTKEETKATEDPTNDDTTNDNTGAEYDTSNKSNVYVIEVISKNDPRFKKQMDIQDFFTQGTTKFSMTLSVGDIVMCKVTKISKTRIFVEILNIDDAALIESNMRKEIQDQNKESQENHLRLMTNLVASENGENFKGIIRSQDIRSTDRDKVKVNECFMPGDIIRAEILSLGDGINYYLTTARNDLGVIFAKSDHGNGDLMYALDWETMIVPSTGDVEKRKCAKPF